MHALITTDAVGGVWTYAIDLCAELCRSGVQCLLVCVGPSPSVEQRGQASRVAELICLSDTLDWLAPARAEVAGTADAVAALATAAHVDIVHCNTPAYAALALFPCPVIAMTHSCLATWWSAVKGAEPLPDDFQWRSELHRDGLLAASSVCAPSSAFARATRDLYRLAVAPAVVHNGRSLPEQAETENSGIEVFSAGRIWDEGKGFATLDLVASHLSCPLHVAGRTDGPNGTHFRFENAKYVGELLPDQIAAVLSDAPVFVSTALYEPFGLTVLEAAQRGSALVLSDIPVFRELWDGVATFVQPDDVRGFTRAIEDIVLDPGQRACAGTRARERSCDYSSAAMAASTIALYESVLTKHVGSRLEAG